MNEIIAFALRMRALMLAFFALVMIGGFIAFLRLNIEAYPDPVPPLVDIVTQNPGQSAEEIERYITIPIEVHVATAPYLTAMRTISLFGLSDVKLQFTYDLTYEEAELCEAPGVTRGGFYAHRYALVPLVTAMPTDATGPRAPYCATSASQSVHPVGMRQHVEAHQSKDNEHNHGGHDPHYAHFGFFSVSFIWACHRFLLF
jgi:hypothetical protein